jgi:hypothetical protein
VGEIPDDILRARKFYKASQRLLVTGRQNYCKMGSMQNMVSTCGTRNQDRCVSDMRTTSSFKVMTYFTFLLKVGIMTTDVCSFLHIPMTNSPFNLQPKTL